MLNHSPAQRRVLLIAYHFPPNASSGTFRSLKFVKYLRQFGWEPVVLSVDPRYEPCEPMDPALLADMPDDVTVIRTQAGLPLQSRQQTTAKKPPTQPPVGDSNPGTTTTGSSGWNWFKKSVQEFVQFPDRHNGWYPFAVWAGWRAIRRYQVDALYASSPPSTGILVGLTLKLLTGKPLVSDFRDPWSKTYGKIIDQQSLSRKERWLHILETKVFAVSSYIINVSVDLTDRARANSPPTATAKFITIYNGFDTADFAPVLHRVADEKFRIVYTGCFYDGMREPTEFLLALQILANQSPQEFQAMEVWFVGDLEWIRDHSTWVAQLGLGAHAQFKPFVPHQESLHLLAESDLLLMIGSIKKTDTGNLPAKLFEYAATRRPILALVHEGESAKFVRSYGMGRSANPENPQEIANVLLQMYREIRAGTFPSEPNTEFLHQYDRRELTRQLATVLDQSMQK